MTNLSFYGLDMLFKKSRQRLETKYIEQAIQWNYYFTQMDESFYLLMLLFHRYDSFSTMNATSFGAFGLWDNRVKPVNVFTSCRRILE